MTTSAVLADALGTLVELERPWPHLVRELAARGVAVTEEQARDAMLAEMSYYREHHDDAKDEAGLADLRRRCAAILRERLASTLDPDEIQAAMLAALRFRPYPEVPGVLRALRDGGARIVVVSNWDVSLHGVLARTGLDALVDDVVTSAEFGVAKPDRRIFEHALGLAGAEAHAALHVGDDVAADIEGALGAGITPVLVARDGEAPPPGVRAIATLEGLLPVP